MGKKATKSVKVKKVTKWLPKGDETDPFGEYVGRTRRGSYFEKA